ncbi:MAG TPA: heavy metal-binding domain-containing protein [Allosphingosinicella sp.]
MKILKLMAIAAVAMLAVAQPSYAKKTRTYVVVNEAVGVPVFPHDFSDRPYTVLGQVKAGVRKATIFSKEASQKKIYRELWERAEKMGADAVINATYGDSHVSAMSWGKTNAKGTAIRFTTSATAAPTPE